MKFSNNSCIKSSIVTDLYKIVNLLFYFKPLKVNIKLDFYIYSYDNVS